MYDPYEQYEESQEMALWVRALLGVAVVGMGIGCYYMFAEPAVPRPAAWMFLVVTLGMLWAYWVFRRLEIRVARGKLEFGFGPFRPKADVQDIESITPERITLRRYGGIGIHVGSGAVCYNTRFGEGVRVRVRGRKLDWVFTTDKPEEVARALGKTIEPGHAP